MTEKEARLKKSSESIVNWTEVYRRLDAARAELNREQIRNAGEQKEVLKARAKAMASEEVGETPGKSIDVIEFLLGQEKYAMELSYVREVRALKHLTPLPGAPPFVLGLTNVRGRIVSVLDIRKLFGLPEKGLTDLNKVMIIGDNSMEFAVLADQIQGRRAVWPNELESGNSFPPGIQSDYVMGITSEPLVLLDAALMLSDKRIIVNEDVEE